MNAYVKKITLTTSKTPKIKQKTIRGIILVTKDGWIKYENRLVTFFKGPNYIIIQGEVIQNMIVKTSIPKHVICLYIRRHEMYICLLCLLCCDFSCKMIYSCYNIEKEKWVLTPSKVQENGFICYLLPAPNLWWPCWCL